jgi:type VI secretion system secreted protein Hcp
MAEQTGVAHQRRAADISLTITGKKQGKIKGSSLKKERADHFDIYEVEQTTTSPRDMASGQATGRRQHHPLIVVGELEKAVPQLYTALVMNEVLTEVKLEFWRSKEGKQTVYYTILLNDAAISELETYTDEDGRPNYKAHFTYAKITWTFADGNITATDTWHGTT